MTDNLTHTFYISTRNDTVDFDASATSTPADTLSLHPIDAGSPQSIEARVAHLIAAVAENRKEVDAALTAVLNNKTDTDGQYAIIVGQVVDAVRAFQKDAEAAEQLFRAAKVACRSDTANADQYRAAKYLMGNRRGGGPTSKVATVAAALKDFSAQEALDRIRALGSFAKAYAHFQPSPKAANDNKKFVGAVLVVRLQDGSEGIINLSPDVIARFDMKKLVTWKPAKRKKASVGV